MFPFRKILCPVDYSKHCEAVVPYAQEIAQRFSADLTLVHAYGEALAHNRLAALGSELVDGTQPFEEQRLRDFSQEVFPGRSVNIFVQLGDTAEVLQDVVQREGTDLVMLATRGHGAVRRFLLGSVTAKVLHDLDAAVWTGTGTALMDHTPQIPYQSVLCAISDTDEAEAVLKAAAVFACSYGARWSIVHVTEVPPAAVEVDFSPYRDALVEAADTRLRELKRRLNMDVPHTVTDGTVAEQVRREVLRQKADIIIAGRGRTQTGISRMWSHLYQIVRESPCPVLSI